jgi:SAM-dependent methyltransferase
MFRQNKKKPYEKVSLIYEGLMKEVDFGLWTKYILEIACNYADTASSILEIAAGNCKMAERIKIKFPDLIATDVSLPMLKSIFQDGLIKVCCNMTRLPFRKKFDFIYCTFDSINYLLTQKELQSLFNEIRIILTESGIFTFDASLERNSLDFTRAQVTEDKYRDFSFKRINSYNRETKIHKNVFHIQNKTGVKYKEVHKQKIYDLNTYFNLVDKAGLFVKECYDGFTFKECSSKSERAQFIIGKSAA